MNLSEFQFKYSKRLKNYAYRFAKKWNILSMKDDLEQACWIAVLENLKYYKDFEHNKSAFNLLAGSMRRSMEHLLRNEHNLKAHSKCPIETTYVPFLSDIKVEYNLDLMIDLKRTLQNDPKPKQINHLILVAVNEHDGAEIARSYKVTRQGINKSIRMAKERLRLRLA